MRMGLGYRRSYKKTVIIVLCAVIVAGIILKRLEPAYDSQLEGYANSVINDIVNNSVNEVFSDGEYNSMTSSDTGKITALEADTAKINRLKSGLLVNIQNKIKSQESQTVYVPLMSASGFSLLSGIGPEIPVKIAPVSLINSDFEEKFESAGINQVIHRLTLDITASVSYSGFMYSKRENVSVKIPVIETVISGDTPKVYGGNIISSAE